MLAYRDWVVEFKKLNAQIAGALLSIKALPFIAFNRIIDTQVLQYRRISLP